MKYYIIAGEASGDLHASRLIRAIKQRDPQAAFRAWGGDLMEKEGATIVKHYRELGFMGFVEVVKNLPVIFGQFRFCKKDILSYQPDMVVFVDYPGFNLLMAKFVKSKGFRTAYYISPQVWAWKQHRVKMIKKVIDRMLVILPLEKDFYKAWDYSVDYVGHPLIEIIDDYKASADRESLRHALVGESETREIVALLPGSRMMEISNQLPVMVETAKRFPDLLFVVGQARSVNDDWILPQIKGTDNIKVVKGNTYGLLSIADAALVTSGTATLETALFGVPQVVCYKAAPISMAIGRMLVKVPYISLVNLIVNKEVVRELIQEQLTADRLSFELNKLLKDPATASSITASYRQLHEMLFAGGKASENAAEIICGMK